MMLVTHNFGDPVFVGHNPYYVLCPTNLRDEAEDILDQSSDDDIEDLFYEVEGTAHDHSYWLLRASNGHIEKHRENRIVSADKYVPPPVGPGHPLFEKVVDVIRTSRITAGKIAVMQSAMHSYQFNDELSLALARSVTQEETKDWARIRPALQELVDADVAKTALSSHKDYTPFDVLIRSIPLPGYIRTTPCCRWCGASMQIWGLCCWSETAGNTTWRYDGE